MNLGETGLLPKKFTSSGGVNQMNDERIVGWNNAIDRISQIPLDLVKFVKVDEKELESFLWQRFPDLQELIKPIAKVLASKKNEWLKVKEAS